MITKTSKLDQPKYDGFIAKLDMLKEEGVITRAQRSIFISKIDTLFGIPGKRPEILSVNHWINKYSSEILVFHKLFHPHSVYSRMTHNALSMGKHIPHITLTFVEHDDGVEYKLLVHLAGNNVSELPCDFYLDDQHVSTMDVKNLKTVKQLVKRLIGQKLYND